MQASNEKKAIVYITKTKYKVLQESLATFLEENGSSQLTDDILQIICDSFMYDPNLKCYDKERVKKKCAETGLSTYELFTRKYYEKNKESIDKKNMEAMRKRRENTTAVDK
jgi:hypothetical protein